jgi:hypothetical protein
MVLSTFRRLLARTSSKDKEVPQPPLPTKQAVKSAKEALSANLPALLKRPRPQLLADINSLRRQHQLLVAQFKALPLRRLHVRRAKLRTAMKKLSTPRAQSTSVKREAPGAPLSVVRKQSTLPVLRRPLTSRTMARGALQPLKVPKQMHSINAQGARFRHEATRSQASSNAPKLSTRNQGSLVLKQAANAHRMSRLRAWSHHHHQGVWQGEGSGTASVEATADRRGSLESLTGVTLGSWSILADLQMENVVERKRSMGWTLQDIVPKKVVAKLPPRRQTDANSSAPPIEASNALGR